MDISDDLPFEQALAELESVVQKLEGEELALEETVELYQRGRALAQHCQKLLDRVALRVEQLAMEPDGTVRIEPFDPQDTPG